MNDSIKLTNFWVGLKTVKDKLDNEIIPVAGFLGVGDPDLMNALETLSAKIQNHFERFRLVAVVDKNKR